MNLASTVRPSRQRRKEARPQELMDAALALFTQHGLAATRMEAVAARAGVSKAALYLYFPSKEALFRAVVRQSLAALIAEGEREATALSESATERLRAHGRWWVRLYHHPASAVFKLALTELARFPDLARFYEDEIIAPGVAILREQIARGVARGEFRPVDVNATAQSLIAPLVLTCVHRHGLAQRQQDVSLFPHGEAFIRQHIELMIAALKSGL